MADLRKGDVWRVSMTADTNGRVYDAIIVDVTERTFAYRLQASGAEKVVVRWKLNTPAVEFLELVSRREDIPA